MEAGVMPTPIVWELDNEAVSERRVIGPRRSYSESEISVLSFVDEPLHGNLPLLPKGRGTVRRKPAISSLRPPFATLIDFEVALENGTEELPSSPRIILDGTISEPPSPPVTPELPIRAADAIRSTSPTAAESSSTNAVDPCPFPLEPTPITVGTSISGRIPKRRCVSAGELPLTPPTTPDRFIAYRDPSHDASRSFRVSKPTQQLSSAERLLRQGSDTPDPFRTPSIARQGRPRISSGQSNRNVSGQIHVVNSTNLLQTPTNPQTRQVSSGAVWNVGGAAASAPSGPINGVLDGQGGLLGSGTNAPMYTSRFFESNTPDQDRGRLEGRLAAALNIDQANRIFNHSQSPDRSRGTKIKIGGSPSKSKFLEQRTVWKDGQWIREEPVSFLDAPQLRDDYYCSVLAYSYTSQTLAVGLSNRVYLWSEGSGVQYPELRRSDRRNTYVTSLSFSSATGGHSILAMGRNDGQLSLWSLHDRGVRFETQLPTAVACLAFKPVTTRRPSARFGSLVDIEELLVGDELGNVYYYCLEWMTDHQSAIHGWNGALKLMAKISVHTQQICGLAWSPDGEYFASGANDNACCLFNVRDVLSDPNVPHESGSPQNGAVQTLMAGFGFAAHKHRNLEAYSSSSEQGSTRFYSSNGPGDSLTFSSKPLVAPSFPAYLEVLDGRQKHRWLHSAAIKAIAFCPWQRGLLATGGGSNDRAIHFYHTFSGACLATIDVQAQVTSLIWSTSRREIAATFGYAQPDHPYRIAVFSWPECRQVVAIPWASEMRALLAIPYPGGPNETSRQAGEGGIWWSRTAEEGCIVVASSDESVKFHEIWTGSKKSTVGGMGLLGGSDILESLEGVDKEGREVIR
ncbi:MAG: hypothetical protein Q9195_007009 [Heterodermia aff. obscurata]